MTIIFNEYKKQTVFL